LGSGRTLRHDLFGGTGLSGGGGDLAGSHSTEVTRALDAQLDVGSSSNE
jgi:hypothetical protein